MKEIKRRVVITGLGVISSIGIGKDEFWSNLIKGKSGISKIESFDTKEYDRHYGGEIKNFKPEEFIDRRKIERMGRTSQLAVSASKLALEDAKIKINPFDTPRHKSRGLLRVDTERRPQGQSLGAVERIKDLAKQRSGVCCGTTMGETQILEVINKVWLTQGLDKVNIKLIPDYPTNEITANLGKEFGLKAANLLFSNACAAGNYSIGYAFDLIRNNRVDLMLAGGVDAFSRINFVGFGRLYAIAPQICQPFDKKRKGMLVSEGAGMLVLESLEAALKRKAPIYAEVLGYGLSCDAYQMTTASVEGVATCLKKSLKEANIKPEQVDYINAHGTGTPTNDKVECAAIKKVFKNYKKIPVSSIKSMLGHTMGAASAIEALACCLTIKQGIIPPTINFKTPDPECDVDCVPNVARKKEVNIVLNNSQAFGGNNACVVLRKFVK